MPGWFHADVLTMSTGDQFTMFSGQSGTADSFQVQVQKTASARQIRLQTVNDSSTALTTSWADLPAGWHAVEIQIKAAELANANNGLASLWLDGTLVQTLTNIDNDDLAIDSVRLGAMGVDTGTSGFISYDDFDSRRFSLIGLLPDPGTQAPTPTPVPSWDNISYSYNDADHVHAVTGLSNDNAYEYDLNGNMTCRVEAGKTYVQSYNAENRMSSALLVSGTCANQGSTLAGWAFTYDGDGSRVKQVYTDGSSSLTTYYFAGGSYEVRSDGSTIKYYAFAGMTLAMDDGQGMKYFLTDHLGSIVAVTDAIGTLVSEQRYMPFGQVRTDVGEGITQTDFGYTSQRDMDAQGNQYSLGLMDYRARMYSVSLGRFTQPDTLVPGAGNPQAWNRYSYGLNNPSRYTDPSGHRPACNDTDDPSCEPEMSLEESWRAAGAVFGITFSPNWSANNMAAVVLAANKVGNAFSTARGNTETATDAFKAIYDHINLIWVEEAGMCGDDAADSGGCTDGAHQVRFWSLSGHMFNDMTRMIKNVVHEFGHAFDNSLGHTGSTGNLWRPDLDMPAGFTRDSVLRPNPIAANRWDWQQSRQNTSNEIFADMFIAWTYNAWNTDPFNAAVVNDAQIWMNNLVPMP